MTHSETNSFKRAPARCAGSIFRPIHLGLLAIAVTVILVAALERKPGVKDDYDPERDQEFADSWDSRVHLAYWEKWGSFEREACQSMVDAFNRSQDEIFVHYINTSEVDRKSMLSIMSGEPPDVVGLWSHNVPAFSQAGALLPLDDLMEESALPKEQYIPNYLKLCTYRGATTALPTTPSSIALYYNKKHFRENAKELEAAGLDPEYPPRMVENLDRCSDILSIFDDEGRPQRMGFLPTEPGWFNWSWGYYFGGRLFDPENQRITADDPGNIEALVWAKKYAERYGREKMLQFQSGFGNFDSPQNAFIDGRVSMELQGVWFSNFIRRHRPHMEFGVSPPPVGPGVTALVSVVDCDVIAIPRGCPHPDEAWQFVLFTQREGSAILCRLQGKHVPARNPPEGFREGHPNLELSMFERLAASPDSCTQPRIRGWREYRHEMIKAFEHIWNWPVPEKELRDLTGAEREEMVVRLCKEEVTRTLRAVRERIQRQFDNRRLRDKMRAEGGPQ